MLEGGRFGLQHHIPTRISFPQLLQPPLGLVEPAPPFPGVRHGGGPFGYPGPVERHPEDVPFGYRPGKLGTRYPSRPAVIADEHREPPGQAINRIPRS